MKRSDDITNNKDEESDISEDAVLSALHKDLGSVLSFTDNRLTIFLGTLLATTYLLDYLQAPSIILFVGVVLCMVGAIGYTIFSVFKRKQRIAAKYGLVCRVCGHKPKTSQIMLVAQTQRCAACGKELNVHIP